MIVISQLLVFISTVYFLFSSQLAQAQIIVKTDTLSISGFSDISADKLTVFAGIAGPTDPVTGTSTATTNTCTLASSSLTACNQSSVHSSLIFKVSFQVTKDVTNAAVKMCVFDGTTCSSLSTGTVTATANSTTVTTQATWSVICSAIGLSSSCSGTTAFISRTIKVGVDEDNSGDVEDDEYRNITLKVHYFSASDSPTLNYCATTATGSGMCNIAFIPGDQKAFIDTAIYAGNDPAANSVPWDSIAIFPVAVASTDAATVSGFRTNQASPIFKGFNATDGTIPDSSVSGGGVENGSKYCFIYGTKNQTQNIYRFVINSSALNQQCIEPSQVVGILDNKSCFISTAAFGSDMAPEVQMFRNFRNEYLLSNSIGKIFVKTYYQLSPPMAHLIAKHDWLRSITRFLLYPFLLFAYLTVQLGFTFGTLALFAMLALIAGVFLFVFKLKKRGALVALLILCATPILKAEVRQNETQVQHEGAKEGLVKISKDGTYIYDLNRKLKKESSKITFGVANYPDITLEVTTKTSGVKTYSFENLYAQSPAIIIGYDYENFLWTDKGKLGYQIGGSLMYVTGNGVLTSTGDFSQEKFTFLTLPLNVGGVYRFEYKDKQLFAPYVTGGGTLLALLEKREDVSTPGTAGGFGFFAAAGLLINTAVIDPDSGFQLDSEYGISNLWLALEFKVTDVNGKAFSYSNRYVNAGLSFDF